MPHRQFVIVLALISAIGVPMFYVVVKRRAEASLRALLSERFAERACPVLKVAVPSGGHVLFHSAYTDTLGTGLVLVLGNWVWSLAKGGPHKRVAGLFKPGGDAAWAGRFRIQRGVIVAALVEGGALLLWKELPSRESILAHFEAVSTGEPKGTR